MDGDGEVVTRIEPRFAKRTCAVSSATNAVAKKRIQDVVEVLGLRLRKVCYYDGGEFEGPGVPWPLVYNPLLKEYDRKRATKVFACLANLKAWLEADSSTSAHMFTLVEDFARKEFGFAVGPPAALNKRGLRRFSLCPSALSLEDFSKHGDY